jgi:MFS family permease
MKARVYSNLLRALGGRDAGLCGVGPYQAHIQAATHDRLGGVLSLSFGLASASDGPFWAATIDAGGENTGAACGVLNTGSNIGGFIAPVLTPFIASLLGWSSALYFRLPSGHFRRSDLVFLGRHAVQRRFRAKRESTLSEFGGYSGEGEHRIRREDERHSGAKVNSSRSEATLAR